MDLKQAVLLCFLSILCTLAFGYVFRMTKKNIPFATLGGFLTCIVYVCCCFLFKNEFFQNLIPALFAAGFAEILARLRSSTASVYCASMLIILIPGAKLYYTMYYFITGDSSAFHDTLIQLLRIAGGISVGIVLVTVVVREALTIKEKWKSANNKKKC